MIDENPTRDAADSLYGTLSEHTDDVLDEACADTWPGGADQWYDVTEDAAAMEAHREATFRLIMAELASMCLERSLGRYNGTQVDAS